MKPTTDIERAAVNWWRSKRPIAYDQKQHLAQPRVNTQSAAERRLANAVAALVRQQRAVIAPQLSRTREAVFPQPQPIQAPTTSESDARGI